MHIYLAYNWYIKSNTFYIPAFFWVLQYVLKSVYNSIHKKRIAVASAIQSSFESFWFNLKKLGKVRKEKAKSKSKLMKMILKSS